MNAMSNRWIGWAMFGLAVWMASVTGLLLVIDGRVKDAAGRIDIVETTAADLFDDALEAAKQRRLEYHARREAATVPSEKYRGTLNIEARHDFGGGWLELDPDDPMRFLLHVTDPTRIRVIYEPGAVPATCVTVVVRNQDGTEVSTSTMAVRPGR